MNPVLIPLIRQRHFSTIKPNHRAMRGTVRALGFDIETYNGIPYILSMYSEPTADGGELIDQIYAIKPGEGLLLVLKAAIALDRQRGHTGGVIAGAHNLRFDLGVLTYDYIQHVRRQSWADVPNPEAIDLVTEYGSFHLRIGKVCFATLKHAHRSISFIDTFAYFRCGLNAAAESIGIKERKKKKPKYLGLKKYSLRTIREYAGRDAFLVAKLLDQIVEWWRQYEIRPAISAPQMAARVFCHRFVKRPWVTVPQTVNQLAMLAYHGGKNGVYVRPGWYRLKSYDVRSAYPWAMTKMPPMTQGEWVWRDGPPDPGEWGFTLIRGEMPELPYPVLCNHTFQPIKAGPFGPIAVTSLEYDLLKRIVPSFELHAAATCVWKPDEGQPLDLKAYAEEMFAKRLEATDDKHKQLYKLLGNSLYGKFIARSPLADERDEETNQPLQRAGQLFYPPIAAWITAYVRVRITELEYQYKAAHTSTDGFLTPESVTPPDLGPDLGQLKLVHEGPCLILRNKLYLHFDDDGILVNAALHGFQGTSDELMRMIKRGVAEYRIGGLGDSRSKLTGWKESVRLASLPFAPTIRPMKLHVPEIAHVGKGAPPAVWRAFKG